MYIVQVKENQQVVWQDATLTDGSTPPERAYPGYDPETMEWGWSKDDTLPAYYKIDELNQVVAATPADLIASGLLTLEPHQRLENGEIADKSLAEQVAEGLLLLEPHQKVEGNEIVDKTPAELVAEGLLALAPNEKVVGNLVVPKSLEELVAEGQITLEPEEKIVNGERVPKSLEELVAEGLRTLDQPFEYAQGNESNTRTVQECLEQNLLKTEAQCQRAHELLERQRDAEASTLYSKSKELRLLRHYIGWLEDGKPANDPRQKDYKALMADLNAIDSHYAPLFEKIEAVGQTLSQNQ